jgi:ABC-2 type transport system permease protein
MKKYIKVWLKTTGLTLESLLMTRGASFMYVVGKILRFAFFAALLLISLGSQKSLAGFDLRQMIIFFLIFNVLDIFGQLFYRGIYWLRPLILSGDFDLYLVKPINSLFLVLTRRTDVLDLPLLFIILFILIKQDINITFLGFLAFFFMFSAALLIITGIHIIIASIGVITTEVDHTVWVYRDLSLMARVPIDIYLAPVRTVLTFIIPIALVFTFPAKALLGILSWQWVIFSLCFSLIFLIGSLKFWDLALTQYSPASS